MAVDSEKYFQIVKDTVPQAVPIMRPAETATDEASSESVLLWFANEYGGDVISLVQATSPLVSADDFRSAWKEFVATNADSLVTGVRFQRFIWTKEGLALNYDPFKRPRRQDMVPQVMENGAFYFTRKEILERDKCRLGGKIAVHEMNPDTEVEIDEPEDWAKIESVLERRSAGIVGATVFGDIKVVVIDVDGTLTDGGMYYGPDGEAFKKFNTRDGAAIATLRTRGFRVVVCTGEASPAVRARIEKLGLPDLLEGIHDKDVTLTAWLADRSMSWDQVLYIGDELNDLVCIKKAAISYCPADAHPEVKATVTKVLPSKGGEGVVRDAALELRALGI